MTFAITQSCCTDASCVSVCPVNCIHPTPDEPDFGTTEMLYVDPRSCIDCGACADACPVDAIFPVEEVPAPLAGYADLSRDYFVDRPLEPEWARTSFPRSVPTEVGPLRAAVIGTGPAACYTAQALLRSTSAEVTMIERLPTRGGLLRYGVAPDHPATKSVGSTFSWLFGHPRLQLHLGVEVGTDVSHAEVAAHHHAVVHAVGASSERPLGVRGEDLVGSTSAGAVVGWYNGHPDVVAGPDLTGDRAVVIGNGNVALDIARILTADPDDLAATDIAPAALDALGRSAVREVVVLARRGPEHAAYTASELVALTHLPGVELVLDTSGGVGAIVDSAAPGTKTALLQGIRRETVDWTTAPPPGRRIVLRFLSAPTELVGVGHVVAVRTADSELPTGLAVRAIGFHAAPVLGLPFDASTGIVPHAAGQVVDPRTGDAVPGAFVAGWVKRGATGGIGANRRCADETVGSLIEAASAGRLPQPTGTAREFGRLLRRRAARASDPAAAAS